MQLNVLGQALQSCSFDPLTGFFRDGCCRTDDSDVGSHIVCAKLTAEFLSFSKQRGNDLSTPRPEYGFAGLKAGDQWCLCATRWLEALQAGAAPQIVLAATHENILDLISLETLVEYGIDRPVFKDER
ncbi:MULTISPECIES: DUF2237 family protein [Deefgea]|uniref:DUF2237 family protein n=1 Tax=Deefgea chitinilytica TaxID=570276 RepID=A0ABS2CFS8_9NEIS|nr:MULTISPECIES: DUF2237 domain-containing protein [Deefgea]MBM5573019.1 DUF2237 family protein [Deefgea chitinilytica]MBM9890255.1 DUF2237 domain-containing protein [Deefgea sp. CFH1-16]